MKIRNEDTIVVQGRALLLSGTQCDRGTNDLEHCAMDTWSLHMALATGTIPGRYERANTDRRAI